MILIELHGNCSNIIRELKKFLKDKKPSLLLKNKFSLNCTDYIISDGKIPIFTKMKKIIVFCGGKYTNTIIPNNSICICESTDKNALNKLINADISAITCGMQKNDTVTFSSLENKFLISLQREIKNYKGDIIEPFEFSNIFKSMDKTALLLLNTLALILNNLEKNI